MNCKDCKHYLKPNWCNRFDCTTNIIALTIAENCPEYKAYREGMEKNGVVCDNEFVKFDDGTFLDFRDPTLNNRPAFVLPNNGERVKIIIEKEDK